MASLWKEILRPMDWTEDHDIALMKEVRIENPLKTKKKTCARAQIWQKIADKLSGVKQPLFKESMSKRSIQDRHILVFDKYNQRMRREAAASGISPSYSELDQLIEECIGLEKLEDDLRQKDGKETDIILKQYNFALHYTFSVFSSTKWLIKQGQVGMGIRQIVQRNVFLQSEVTTVHIKSFWLKLLNLN
ncbi:PREDICTED: uncharacterized protein LOC107346753 [Acropora digitifera]|uniref:uncharacterized protein LOC107346753 n=1 Tax=Acropora digitifera TaxID=70779 RepID=UPI00077AFBA3|nr:PREDICTED: uncharacterized protein LOC107346753 [Acropora digitifera]